MTQTRLKGSGFVALFAAAMLSACASEAVGPAPTMEPEEGHAFLKIVGEKNVFVGEGDSRQIRVKYVNDNDEGLAGSVSFRIEGNARGATLSSNSEITGPGGEVTIAVSSGTESAFRIIAEAQYATPVDWAVAVRKGGDNPPLPFNVVGTYRVESTFDLATGLPGDAGEIINTFIDLTDDTNDPTSFLLDLASKEDQGVKNALSPLRPAIDVALNSILKQVTTVSIEGNSISIVTKFAEFGNGFGEVSRKFGLKSQIQIYKDPMDGSKYLAKHTVDGVFFKIKNKRTDRTLAAMNMDNIVVDKIPVTLTGETQVSFGEHNLGLSYGKIIVFGLDNVLIPLITENRALNLRELLADLIDCYDVGDKLADELGFGSPDLYESLCETALAFAGSYLEGKLSEVGGTASEFKISGTVRPADTDSNGTVDQLIGGEWEGRLMLGNEAATLAKPNQKFTGMRMGN